jgi:hypothetical protein
MSKTIIFSRRFPAHHPNSDDATYFIEKILNWYWDQPNQKYNSVPDMFKELNPEKDYSLERVLRSLNEEERDIKSHTIRAGKRWKVGDKFSPRVWSGKPYNSKQIIICPDIEIKKIFDFVVIPFPDKSFRIYVDYKTADDQIINDIALNDGLSYREFLDWFLTKETKRHGFKGQIICWNENISY